MDQQSREKYAVAIICDLVSDGFDPEFFYFPYQKRFLTSPVGFALTSDALTKIKFIIPNITREKKYMQAWTARLWQSPSCTATVPTVQTQHSLEYMKWPGILDRALLLLLLLPLARNVWRQSEATKLSFPRASEHWGQYKHHLQSLQVVNPTYVQGVCQSHWIQVIQFLVITILETISRNEVCV